MSTAMAGSPPTSATAAALLGDPEVRRFLRDYVKKRVGADDVDDVVQTVLVDALASARQPVEVAEVRRWLVGIARHKCADVHRRAGRERPPVDDLPDLPADAPPLEERSLVRWAEEQARGGREADKTLGWMAREGEGDKLEHIAEEEALPPARVRQRVSRMRRLLKERWLAELALVAALGAVALVLWRWLRHDEEGPIVADPTPPAPSAPAEPQRRIAEGQRLRVGALEVCRQGEHGTCLDALDRARELDPEGDATVEVREARERAAAALEQQQRPPEVQQPAPLQQKSAPPPAPSATTPPPPVQAPQKPTAPPRPKAPPPTATPPTAPPEGKGGVFPKKAPSKESFDGDFGSKKKKAPSDL